MIDEDPVLVKMNNLLAGWEAASDRRLIFLTCYQMMTRNILAAIEANDFEDAAWVDKLMTNFAEYYFVALDAYEHEQANYPIAWRIAFKAAHDPHTHVLQNLVLGVNAHINYDLVLALSDLLAPEWSQLSTEQRQMRYRDHCHVNDIIYQTVNAVQDQVIDRYMPEFDIMDKLFGPLDEWMTSLLISEWREEVWKHATHILDPIELNDRQVILQRVEQVSVQRARDILGKGGVSGLLDFL